VNQSLRYLHTLRFALVRCDADGFQQFHLYLSNPSE
jgi:hypothetical protein